MAAVTDPDDRLRVPRAVEPDSALVLRARRGDAAAFETIFDRHSGWVTALAMRFLGQRDDALDVLSETFEYLVGKMPSLTLTTTLRGFLYPVVRHLSISKHRQRKRRANVDDVVLIDASWLDAWIQPDLRKALAAVEPPHREVVLMRFGDGLSVREIAEALAIPEGTVKSRLHHAIRALREVLGS